jgi:hypothetical protein
MSDYSAIDRFIELFSDGIIKTVMTLFEAMEIEAVLEGEGIESCIHVKNGEKSCDFFMGNLLLEIATIDRDDRPLVFDKALIDPDRFYEKSSKAITSKLAVLMPLLMADDHKKAIEDVKNMKGYERIRIIEVDKGNKPDKRGFFNPEAS